MVSLSATVLGVLMVLGAISLHGCGSAGNDGKGKDDKDGTAGAGNDGKGKDGKDGTAGAGNDGNGNDGKDGTAGAGNDGNGKDGKDGTAGTGATTSMSNCVNWVHECQGGNDEWCAEQKTKCEQTSLIIQEGLTCFKVLGSNTSNYRSYCGNWMGEPVSKQNIVACKQDVVQESRNVRVAEFKTTHCSSPDTTWCDNEGKKLCSEKIQELQRSTSISDTFRACSHESHICLGSERACQEKLGECLPSWKSGESLSLLEVTPAMHVASKNNEAALTDLHSSSSANGVISIGHQSKSKFSSKKVKVGRIMVPIDEHGHRLWEPGSQLQKKESHGEFEVDPQVQYSDGP